MTNDSRVHTTSYDIYAGKHRQFMAQEKLLKHVKIRYRSDTS